MSDVRAPAGPDGSTSSTGATSGILRRVLWVLALFVVGGAAGGVLWERLWDAPTGLAYQGRWYLEPAGPDFSFEGIALNVLGPVEVRRGGVLVPVEGLKRRQLLAVLVAARGGEVSADRLEEALWEGGPPDSARAARPSRRAHTRKSRS